MEVRLLREFAGGPLRAIEFTVHGGAFLRHREARNAISRFEELPTVNRVASTKKRLTVYAIEGAWGFEEGVLAAGRELFELEDPQEADDSD